MSARPLSDRIINLLNEVNRPLDRIEVQNWVRGNPRPSKAQAEQALDDLVRLGRLRRVPIRQQRRGPMPLTSYELVHTREGVSR